MATVIDSQTPMASAPLPARLPTPIRVPVPSPVVDDTPQRFVLDWATWQNYVLLSDGVGERRIRVTFDGETVEIMSVSNPHEMWKSFLRSIIETILIERGLRFRPYGNMTIRSESLSRGMEPDECYYVLREPAIRGKKVLDFNVDPFPDFALEIEVSRSVLDRLQIMADLDVREVWRFDGEALTVMLLDENKIFQPSERSDLLPEVPIKELSKFLKDNSGESMPDNIVSLRNWLKRYVVTPAGS